MVIIHTRYPEKASSSCNFIRLGLLPLDEEDSESISLKKALPAPGPGRSLETEDQGSGSYVFLNLYQLNPMVITIQYIMSQGICSP